MGKLWKITIFNGKTMENHYFLWENYGKIHHAINGKIHELNHHVQ